MRRVWVAEKMTTPIGRRSGSGDPHPRRSPSSHTHARYSWITAARPDARIHASVRGGVRQLGEPASGPADPPKVRVTPLADRGT